MSEAESNADSVGDVKRETFLGSSDDVVDCAVVAIATTVVAVVYKATHLQDEVPPFVGVPVAPSIVKSIVKNPKKIGY